jgi:hypothetical protein
MKRSRKISYNLHRDDGKPIDDEVKEELEERIYEYINQQIERDMVCGELIEYYTLDDVVENYCHGYWKLELEKEDES